MTERCQAPTCNRPLKTEESRRRGYGPVCWGRANPSAPSAPAVAEHPVDPNQIPLPLETLVDAETRKAAVDTIARHAINRTLAYDVSPGWEDYPELLEADWCRVVERIQAIGRSMAPSGEGFKAAYEHLTTAGTVQEGQPR